MNMKKVTALILVAGMSVSLAACGAKAENADATSEVTAVSVAAVSVTATPEPTEAVTETAVSVSDVQEEMKTIGEKTEGENVYEILLTNETGKAIKGFAVKDASMETYPENMMAADDVFADGEQRALYYDTTNADQAVTDAETEEDAPLTNPEFCAQLTFEDDTTAELHVFPVEDATEAEIKLEDEIVFLSYVSTESNETVSTKEAELAEKQMEAGTLEADNTQETQTYEEPVQTYEEPVYQEPVYQEPYYQETYVDPGVDANAGCLDDGLTW